MEEVDVGALEASGFAEPQPHVAHDEHGGSVARRDRAGEMLKFFGAEPALCAFGTRLSGQFDVRCAR
jgi:hypothetical protein